MPDNRDEYLRLLKWQEELKQAGTEKTLAESFRPFVMTFTPTSQYPWTKELADKYMAGCDPAKPGGDKTTIVHVEYPGGDKMAWPVFMTVPINEKKPTLTFKKLLKYYTKAYNAAYGKPSRWQRFLNKVRRLYNILIWKNQP